MNTTLRFGTAMSAVLLAAALAACAGPSGRSASNFGRAENFAGKPDTRNIGLATRAQAALLAEQPAVAIDFAERAVAGSPNDAGFRGLLGNAYFAGGRFASAEAAYRDSLSLLSNQPQVVLKLVLVSVAQGKNDQALSFLDAAKNVIDPSDYGLALALAGQPQQAAQSLQQAAQAVGADSRVRQNLALALALSGDWTGARTVAAQDVPADQLDARIQSWMQLAKPARASDQVASLTGITPAAVDLGQPVRLALKDAGSRLAALAPVVEPAPALVSAPVETAVATTAVPALVVAQAAPVAVQLAPLRVAMRTRSAPDYVAASLTPKAARVSAAPRPSLSPRAAALTDARALYRRAALTSGQARSRAVVQLGAFASRGSVTVAWRHASTRFTTLRGYTPLAARFDGERGTVYRLSVQGFGSARQAFDLCGSLKRAGGACFVRNVAGDAPVQIASR